MEQEASEETASENTETSAEEKTTEKAPEKEGFFKKKKDPKDEKIEELTDRVKRPRWQKFDNFQQENGKRKIYHVRRWVQKTSSSDNASGS